MRCCSAAKKNIDSLVVDEVACYSFVFKFNSYDWSFGTKRVPLPEIINQSTSKQSADSVVKEGGCFNLASVIKMETIGTNTEPARDDKIEPQGTEQEHEEKAKWHNSPVLICLLVVLVLGLFFGTLAYSSRHKRQQQAMGKDRENDPFRFDLSDFLTHIDQKTEKDHYGEVASPSSSQTSPALTFDNAVIFADPSGAFYQKSNADGYWYKLGMLKLESGKVIYHRTKMPLGDITESTMKQCPLPPKA